MLVLDREGVHQRQLGGAGIAEHDLDALLLEQIEEGTLSGHDGQRNPPTVGAVGGRLRGRGRTIGGRTIDCPQASCIPRVTPAPFRADA